MIDKNVEIVFNEQIAAGTFLMALNAPEIVSAASPGQFVMVRVGPVLDPLLRRPFSICGIMRNTLLLILYKVVGRGTAIMSEAAKGDLMTILGPLGRGFAKPQPGRIPILISGGIGIAPLIFLAQTLKRSNLIFLTGYRCAADIISFEKLGLAIDSHMIATDDGSDGYQGFVTDLMDNHIRQARGDLHEVFACGPEPMLKKVAALTLEGRISCQMSLESFMACGLGACQGCALKNSDQEELTYHLVCREGPVFNAQDIDWRAL